MTASSLAAGRFRRLPQRASEVWQGGPVRLPMWIDSQADPAAPPSRAEGVLWVSLRTGLVHIVPFAGATPSAGQVFDALVDFGLKWAKQLDGRPARVEVSDPALGIALGPLLDPLATSVTVVDDVPAVRKVLRHLEADTTRGARIAGTLESPGMTIGHLGAFADAAADFYRARPWDHLTNEDLIVVEGHRLPPKMRHVAVLGQGGEQFGLSFFDSRKVFDRLIHAADPLSVMKRAHGVTFGPMHELPFGDVDAWIDHTLPAATPEAYPMLIDMGLRGPTRRPTPRELVAAEALLRALAATTEDELDAGRWTKQVETFDGRCDLTLTLPDLLAAEQVGRGPIAKEGVETPLDRAQDLARDAMEAEGRLRIKRARQALAISPDCADAWVVLAEEASTPEAACERYERAMAAGERAIGADAFASRAGHFWGHVETRPYMRARFGLADALLALGRHAEAIEHCRALLDLNPGDNQGVRYRLIVALLEARHDAGAKTLLETYKDDGALLWLVAQLLWAFRAEGDGPRARAAFDTAVRSNPYVIGYLLLPDALPDARSEYYALGSVEEAADVAGAMAGAFRATPAITPWLAAQVSRVVSQPRRAAPRASRPRPRKPRTRK